MRKYLILILLFTLMFNGLDGVRELTDLAIVKAIGIDMAEDGEFSLSAIVIDTAKEKGNESGIIYTAKGKSIQEAARNMVDVSPKKLYLAHMETLVISEEVAKDNLENSLDFFIRDNEGSNSFYLFVAKECTSEEIINVINEEEIDMISLLKSTQKYKGNANLKTLNEILKDLLKEGHQMCVNSVSINEKKVAIYNMAYFSDWEMKGYLSLRDSILYNILINEASDFIITIGEDDDLIVAEVISSKNKININKEKNNIIDFNITFNATITQTGKNISIADENTKSKIEKQFEEKIKRDIEEFYRQTKEEYSVDLLSIGNLLYRKKSELYNDSDYLQKVSINVKPKFKILSQGGVEKIW